MRISRRQQSMPRRCGGRVRLTSSHSAPTRAGRLPLQMPDSRKKSRASEAGRFLPPEHSTNMAERLIEVLEGEQRKGV